MKFLNTEGQLVEGQLLTDPQVEQRAELIKFLHEKVCGGSYHSAWDRRNGELKCETVANFFITKFTLTPLPGVDLVEETRKLENANAPQAIEASPAPTPAEEPVGF